MDMVIQGAGPNANIEAQVDPSFQASHVTLRPLDHADNVGNVGGHYGVGLLGGALAGALVAPNVVQSTRWADTKMLFVLKRYQLQILCTAFTTGISLDVALYKATQFTAPNSTGAGRVNVTNPSKMRTAKQSASLIVNGELAVAGTAPLSGGTFTLDAAPIAVGFAQIKAAQDVAVLDLYRLLAMGQHPVVLGANEGLILRLESLSLPVTNTIRIYPTIEWAEVPSY